MDNKKKMSEKEKAQAEAKDEKECKECKEPWIRCSCMSKSLNKRLTF